MRNERLAQLACVSYLVLGGCITASAQAYVQYAANNAALENLTNYTGPVLRDGFATAGDGGSALYNHASSSCAVSGGDGATCLPAADGGSWAIDPSTRISPILWGAKFNGAQSSTVDTAAMQSAFNSGAQDIYVPTLGGSFEPNACMTITKAGQHIRVDSEYGGGLQVTILSSLASSNAPTCKGIFAVAAGTAPWIEGINANFAQPDTTNTASYIMYPPLFYLRNNPRFRLTHTTCTNATICIDMRGNSGGSYIDDLKFNAYAQGIWIDGSEDTVRISDPHWYPFNLTANQTTVFNNQGNGRPIGIYSGRMDDLVVSGGLFLGGVGLQTYVGTGAYFTGSGTNNEAGATFGLITKTDFDTLSGVVNAGGSLQISASTFSLGASGAQAIDNQGSASGLFPSTLSISSCLFYNEVSALPFVSQENGAGAAAVTTISSSTFNTGGADAPHIVQSDGEMIIVGNDFERTPNTSYNTSIVNLMQNSRTTFSSNFASDKGTGTGIFVNVGNDNSFNKFIGNSSPGWPSYTPSSPQGQYQFN